MWKKLWFPYRLKKAGILGINQRNLFINEVNKREFYPMVDDKMTTKEICEKLDIPVPYTYGVLKKLVDIQSLPRLINDKKGFVIKPSRGSGGRGIIVIEKHDNENFITPSGKTYTFSDISYHISTVLSGLYSLGGSKDEVIVEQRIQPHRIFGDIAVCGTPDIRIITFMGKPIISMLRLPTKTSRGRANLHQGAVGVGIDIHKGITCGGIYKGKMTRYHPDTNYSLENILINDWAKILDMVMRLSKEIPLGYLGIDVVLDVDRGPLILEANARPGLAIQVANNLGLCKLLGFQNNYSF